MFWIWFDKKKKKRKKWLSTWSKILNTQTGSFRACPSTIRSFSLRTAVCWSLCAHFGPVPISSTVTNVIIFQDMQSDFFRSSPDYNVFRTSLPYSKEKLFEDKNFKHIRFQGPVVCQEHNLTTFPSRHKYVLILQSILLCVCCLITIFQL